MPDRFDYIVVGAGPAGCIAAAELKKMGCSVCIMEKENANYRKVCGDGIGFETISVLRKLKFPIVYFEDAGAVKIHKYINIREGENGSESYSEEIQAEKGKLVYGLARNKTDAVFRRYTTDDAGVQILYDHPVSNLVPVIADDGSPLYEVNGFRAAKIVIAAGASARITLDGRPLVSPDPANPVGVSAILRADNADEPFFLFDFRKNYEGTYGWLFSVGDREYNAGLWLKAGRSRIKEEFNRFLNTRVKEYLGPDFAVIRETRGAIMGIGEKRFHYGDHGDSIFVIGDCSNTSNPLDGEGISRAVSDAMELVNDLQAIRK